MNFEEYKLEGIVEKIAPAEERQYLDFLNNCYKDDLRHSEDCVFTHPRWAIISGYYAMHDLSKLFLAKVYGLKISKRAVHAATICAMQEVLKGEPQKERLRLLLEEAGEMYELVGTSISKYLVKGRDEREKVQYYTGSSYGQKAYQTKAAYFLEQIVKPYTEVLEGLMKND